MFTLSHEILHLPRTIYKASQVTANDEAEHQCSVCLGELRDGESVGKLGCSHQIHYNECLVLWLRINNNCPTCRHVVDPEKWTTAVDEPPKELSAHLEFEFVRHNDSLTLVKVL